MCTSNWHKSKQARYSNIEVCFNRLDGSYKDRRADVVFNGKVIEFQHSVYTRKEISNRKHDYNLHGHDIYWIVDCNNTKVFSINNYYLLDINEHMWISRSFDDYDSIFLDKDDYYYRISPKHIYNNVVLTYERYSQDDFDKKLQDDGFSDWVVHIPPTLYFNQRGAGCGKTYESIQLLADSKFAHKNTFIYLTKVHSAKEVIFKELCDQRNDHKISDLSDMSPFDNAKNNKQYILSYKNNISEPCTVIIGTIDSFIYSLMPGDNDYANYFDGILSEIINDINEPKSNIYAGKTIRLGARCMIIIDEAQDLPSKYLEALSKKMRDNCTSLYIIGDKLQSIYRPDNIMTCDLSLCSGIKIYRGDDINHVRRFHHSKLMNIVNSAINFRAHGLPPIESICNGGCKIEHEESVESFEILNMPPTQASEEDDKFVKEIMGKIELEVKRHPYYRPNNFMIIFPNIRYNHLANMILTSINMYWMKKDKSKGVSYAEIHGSNEGCSIDLTTSLNKTRILSIHASKGLGCEVVFTLGMSENKLNKFNRTGEKNDLVFDSLLHVSMTRQKCKLYLGRYINADKICKIFNRRGLREYGKQSSDELTKFILTCNKNQSLDRIIDFIKSDEYEWRRLDEMYELSEQHKSLLPNQNNNNSVVDWSNHTLRYCVMMYTSYARVFNLNKGRFYNGTNGIGRLFHIMKNISSIDYETKFDYHDVKEYYDVLRSIRDCKYGEDYPKVYCYPILRYTNDKYSKNMKRICEHIVSILDDNLNGSASDNSLPLMCPLYSAVLMHLMEIQCKGIYLDITADDIYDIMQHYDNYYVPHSNNLKFRDSASKYSMCKCDEIFYINTANNQSLGSKIIFDHYEKVMNVVNSVNEYDKYIKKRYPNVMFHYKILYHDKKLLNNNKKLLNNNNEVHDGFNMHSSFNLVAVSESKVIDIICKPQYNKINFSDTILKSLFRCYLLAFSEKCLLNHTHDPKKCSSVHNYNVEACILTLDNDKPIFHDFGIKKNKREPMLDKFLKKYIDKYLEPYEHAAEELSKDIHSKDEHERNEYLAKIMGQFDDASKIPSMVINKFRSILGY